MNVKSKVLLLLVLVCSLFTVGQKSCYGMDNLRQTQQKLEKDWEQVRIESPETRNLEREILRKTFEPTRRPAERLSPSFIKIRDRTNQLLTQEQIKPEEIEALRMNLNEAVENTRSESERAEYEKMGERLDIVQSITELKEKERKLNEIVEKSHENFNQLDEREAKVSLWKNIFSGGFTVSFIANMVALLGFLTKMPSAKLERELKELLIIEKKAKLEQDGIDIKRYI
jgi:myosin heavy subunit